MSAGMHALQHTYTKRFNKKYGRRGYLFRERYSSRWIEDEKHYSTALEYIRQNPVKAGFCERAEDWSWTEISVLPESLHARESAADDERVNLVRPLVGQHGLEVVHVPDDGVLERDAARSHDRSSFTRDL
jgi:hypothetical protein